jgi:hypothetical protein
LGSLPGVATSARCNVGASCDAPAFVCYPLVVTVYIRNSVPACGVREEQSGALPFQRQYNNINAIRMLVNFNHETCDSQNGCCATCSTTSDCSRVCAYYQYFLDGACATAPIPERIFYISGRNRCAISC